jgi:hypothetical protein
VPRSFAFILAAALALILPASALGGARCPEQCQTIEGSPLRVVVAADTSLQVYHGGGTSGQVFPSGYPRGEAGTYIGVDGVQYTPSSHSVFSQAPVAGSGTSADPFTVVTQVQVGPDSLGIRLVETVRMVNGEPWFRIDRRVTNSGTQSRTVRLFHFADFYLQGSDLGYGYYDPATGAIGGQNEAADFFQAFIPITPATGFIEGRLTDVKDAVRVAAQGGPDLPNSVRGPGDPANLVDNAAALQWNITVPAGATRTVSDFWSFGVAPQIPAITPPPTVGAVGPATVTPGGTLTVTGTGFGGVPGTVSVGGVPARVVSWTDTRIVVQVGTGTAPGRREVIVSRGGEVSDPFSVTVAALAPAPNLARTIPSPATIAAGPTRVTFPRRMSLRSLKRSKCVRVVVRSTRPARVLVTIFSGNRSIRLFGQKRVVFRSKGRKVVCIRVPARAKTFDVRTPLRFAVGWKAGARARVGESSPKPKIRDIVLVP